MKTVIAVTWGDIIKLGTGLRHSDTHYVKQKVKFGRGSLEQCRKPIVCAPMVMESVEVPAAGEIWTGRWWVALLFNNQLIHLPVWAKLSSSREIHEEVQASDLYVYGLFKTLLPQMKNIKLVIDRIYRLPKPQHLFKFHP